MLVELLRSRVRWEQGSTGAGTQLDAAEVLHTSMMSNTFPDGELLFPCEVEFIYTSDKKKRCEAMPHGLTGFTGLIITGEYCD